MVRPGALGAQKRAGQGLQLKMRHSCDKNVEGDLVLVSVMGLDKQRCWAYFSLSDWPNRWVCLVF